MPDGPGVAKKWHGSPEKTDVNMGASVVILDRTEIEKPANSGLSEEERKEWPEKEGRR